MKKVKSFFSMFARLFRERPLIFFMLFSFFENLLIETLSRHSLIEAFVHMFCHPVGFLLNTLIIMFTVSFALLFRRRLFGLVMLSAPWLICGIVNCALLTFRVTPLAAIDFQIVKLSLIAVYLSPFQRILLYAGVAVFVAGVITLWILGPKISGKVHYGRNVATIAGIFICIFLTLNIARSMKAIGTDFGNLAGAYDDYGFVYCFSSSVLDTGIDKPEDYSEEEIHKIVSDLGETSFDSTIKPDIILIQLESFIDPKTIKGLTFSDDPAPTHTYLRKNFSHGNLHVPSFGGGTANTEFEVLTGIDLTLFGPGEYPYKTILLSETCESIAYNLKELGYSTHAIHNHTGNFYDRDKVYPNLGFDSFQSLEYMYGYETTSYGWCKDKILTEEILTALDYTDAENGVAGDTPRFVWTVSVQGHGKYPTTADTSYPMVIDVEGADYSKKEMYALEYYINQVWEMDMFLGSLISALEDRDRPTLVVAYGDHLPAIGLYEDDVVSGNAYLTEYVTWNNFGLENNELELSSYELSGEIMSWLGFYNGHLNKLYQKKSEDGSSLTEEEYRLLMQSLSYDMLYGENYQFEGEKPYRRTLMRMGTLPIIANEIKYSDGNLYVYGSGFTDKSTVFINNEKQKTVMLSQYSLMVIDVELKDGDAVSTGQASGKKEVLSYSTPVVYDEDLHLHKVE